MSGNESAVPACGILVLETRDLSARAPRIRGECSTFYLVVAGHARWECGGRWYPLGPDTVCHLPAGQPHEGQSLPDELVLTYALHYRPDLLSASVRSQLAALGMVPVDLRQNLTQARVVRSIFQEMLFEQSGRQEGWETILQSRLMDLAIRVLRLTRRAARGELPVFEPGNDSTDRVARYALRLKSQFFRPETVVQAARSVGLSRRQFSELFRKVTGQSWRRYVLGLRLRHAAELLAHGDRSVSAVAFECGFDDLSNFHHSFKSSFGCSPVTYRAQRRVHLPSRTSPSSTPPRAGHPTPGFRYRGTKGWSWTVDQYLEEIPFLPAIGLNFLMNCYRSMSVSSPGEPWSNQWWRPMSADRKAGFARIIRQCRANGITFCFALHPQLDSPRPLNTERARDRELFYRHYAWAQGQGVQWFSVCLDDTSWSAAGSAACGSTHASLANEIFGRLRAKDSAAQLVLCPAAFWGDASNPEHRAYLSVLGRELHTDIYVFWNGDAIVTPRITRVAAESYKRVVGHRLFLWDNYPVNDGNPTLHLGPVSGRESDLCEVIDGYLCNPLCSQNQINRLPLATCAEYAAHPRTYNPARSIGQAILRLGKTHAQQQLLKDLVESYPGFIVAGGGTGTNPVRARFGSLIGSADPQAATLPFINKMEEISARLGELFPQQFPATKRTVLDDIQWMKQQLVGLL